MVTHNPNNSIRPLTLVRQQVFKRIELNPRIFARSGDQRNRTRTVISKLDHISNVDTLLSGLSHSRRISLLIINGESVLVG